MSAYATLAELGTFTGSAPSDEASQTIAERMLERASELLDDVVVASFAVDAVTELPTDADVASAMSAACCAQVEFWLEVGEESDVDGLAGTDVSIGGYSGRRAPVVCPRALRILRSAGLMTSS